MCAFAWIVFVLLLSSAIGAARGGNPFSTAFGVLALLGLVVLAHPEHGMEHWHGCRGHYSPAVESPFRASQAIVVVALVAATAWRRRHPPRPRPFARRLAIIACLACIVMTALAHHVHPCAAYDLAEMTLGWSLVLLACLVLEVRFDEPLVPRAVARSTARPPARTAS